MGFATLIEGGDFCMLFEPSAGLAIGITNQQGHAAGSFDERRVGLDHLALAAADVATLLRWEQRLTELDVPHGPIATSDACHHLNLRAPDNFPVELFVLSAPARKFVGGSDPGGGVAQVEAAGGVQGVFGCAGEVAGGQGGDFVAVFAGQVDREAPAGG
jgi:glyoxylase I family protein